ncbi:hypothetical protein B1R94_24250 [Mycolicibacterium litorale]|nr:hypothetical protein B1R94_24250 [Mycolicibacterium litorale]
MGTGIASAASPYYGQTYAQAAAKIESRGQTARIATVIGSQLAIDDCIVTNAYKSFTLNDRGRNAHRGTWLLSVNCNRAVAAPGKPGNSVMTPEGQKAKAIEVRADSLNNNFVNAMEKGKTPTCGASAERAANCKNFCDKYGLCSEDLVKYLASL